MRKTDSYDTETGVLCQVVLKLPYFFDEEEEGSFCYCRVNAYSSKVLLKSDFSAFRVGHPVSGLLEKAIRKEKNAPHTAQLIAWDRVAASDWQLLSPYSFFNGGFRLDPTRVFKLPILHSKNFPDPPTGGSLSHSIALQPISAHYLSFHKAPPPPPPKAAAPSFPPPAYPRGGPGEASPRSASSTHLVPPGGRRVAHINPPDSDEDSLFREIIHGVKRASVRKLRTKPAF